MAGPAQADRRRRQSGFTLLETLVAVGIVAVVLQTAASSAVVMSNSGQFGGERTQLLSRSQLVLEKVVRELRNTSRESDPDTNEPDVTVSGARGDQRLTFRRIAEFGSNGKEMVPVWSSPIELFRTGQQLVRRQDGRVDVLLNGVETLDFSIDALGRVDVQLGIFIKQENASIGVLRHVQHIRAVPQR